MAQLGDVQDVERFVRWQVNRVVAQRLSASDVEEAVGEGICTMYELYLGLPRCAICKTPIGECEHGHLYAELHGGWDAARCPRFSALALELLSRRLISWWRKNLRQSGRGNWNGSKGEYTYRQILSLDTASDLLTFDRGE